MRETEGLKARIIVAANPEINWADFYAAAKAAGNTLKENSMQTFLRDTRQTIIALAKAGWRGPQTAELRATKETKESTPESQRFRALCIVAANPEISADDAIAAAKAAGIRLKESTVRNAWYDVRKTIDALKKTGWQPPGAAEPEEATEAGGQLKEVGAFEAKTRLGQLLDLAERGEEVVITRHGREVARLVPPKTAINRAEARAAATRIREMRKGVTLGELSLKDLINEGRL